MLMTEADAESRVDPPQERPAAPDHPVVLFDGVCNFCHGWVRFALPRDRRGVLRFAAQQSGAGQRLLAEHRLPLDAVDSLVFVDAGQAYRDSTAVLNIMGHLGGVWRVCAGLLRVVPRPLRDWVYGVIAARRYRWFGKLDACPAPPAQWRDRFLDAGA